MCPLLAELLLAEPMNRLRLFALGDFIRTRYGRATLVAGALDWFTHVLVHPTAARAQVETDTQRLELYCLYRKWTASGFTPRVRTTPTPAQPADPQVPAGL